MKASVLHNLMAVHPQQQQQPQMVPALAAAGTGCDDGNQAASVFQQTAPLTLFPLPESEPTCYGSGSRKRPRDAQPPLVPLSDSALCQQQKQHVLLQRQLLLLKQIQRRQTNPAAVDVSSRLNQSAMTSTSGCQALISVTPPDASPTNQINTATCSSPSSLASMLHDHSHEVDALVRLHADKLRSAMIEACKRQCLGIVTAMEQKARSRIAEKQTELDAAVKRNAELEERLRQAETESQAWFTIAKNSESTIAQLRASLEQAIQHKASGGKNRNDNSAKRAGGVPLAAGEEEGYGDSEDEAAATAASAASAPMMDSPKPSSGEGCTFACRSCGEADACVLLLPCRHLCLCQSCGHSTMDCPVCGSRRNASLPINLS